jgi:hypothetical protein
MIYVKKKANEVYKLQSTYLKNMCIPFDIVSPPNNYVYAFISELYRNS